MKTENKAVTDSGNAPNVQFNETLALLNARQQERNLYVNITETDVRREMARVNRNKARRERDQAMRDIGMVKVRGNLGGTYWE